MLKAQQFHMTLSALMAKKGSRCAVMALFKSQVTIYYRQIVALPSILNNSNTTGTITGIVELKNFRYGGVANLTELLRNDIVKMGIFFFKILRYIPYTHRFGAKVINGAI